MKTKPANWIKEEQAIQMQGYAKGSLRILTRNEKRKKLPIRTSKINHKTILYSKTDIETYIDSKATAI